MFSEYPDVPGGFHETVLQVPDRRGIASFGPFYDVAPGDRICFDMAFVFARDTTQDNIQNTRVLQEKVIALKEWYAQQGLGCDAYVPVGMPGSEGPSTVVSLFPNPVQEELTITRSATEGDCQVLVRSVTGQEVARMKWPRGTGTLRLNARSWPAGVYILSLIGNDRSTGRRFVVAH